MAAAPQWVHVYRLGRPYDAEIVHAHYVEHRFARHAHEHFVIGLVEEGIQQYTYRGARHITPTGHIFFVNGDEPHTGEPATAEGYVYRTLCLCSEAFRQLALDTTNRNDHPYLDGTVIVDRQLFVKLQRLHRAVAANEPAMCCQSFLLSAAQHLLETHAEIPRQVPAAGKDSSIVRQVREYVKAHYSEDISLTQLAALTSRSPFHVARAFSEAVGLPPHAYLESIATSSTFKGCTESQYRFDEVDSYRTTPTINLFAEYQPWKGTSLRIEADNVLPQHYNRIVNIYAGPRNAFPLSYQDDRSLTSSASVLVSLRKTF